eukprot:NODE_25971_length_569_cov_2.579186.p1 GENE.NODE_25971_length_569_cov_2.579186~~NODE_25971_length_569_cov_2.579186.p1  ORF type:complete len:144 (+),score=37.31 NODE_25971_length_569_cov_2.579186:76-507(+)
MAIGVFACAPPPEWMNVTFDDDIAGFGGTSASAALLSTRLSYALGMKGPSFSIECESASGLVALQCAVDSISHHKDQSIESLVIGDNMMLMPAQLLVSTLSRESSMKGRCFSFDDGADGLIYGEAGSCRSQCMKRPLASTASR